MEKKKNSILFINIILLIININKYISSYLPSGLNQLNNFIYLDRMKIFSYQKLYEKCSLKMGPNCYYAEEQRSLEYEKDINSNNINEIELNSPLDQKKEWMNIYFKSKISDYSEVYEEISNDITNYKKYILSNNDPEQIPPSINLYLGLTFESYDEQTIKGDVYALPSKQITFFTEYVYIEITGKLRLRYGEDLKLKNQMKYPTKTYGIIESNNLMIKLGNKLFICEFFFTRVRDKNVKRIKIEGYLGNVKIYSVEKEVNFMHQNAWTKVSLPNSKIDRLILPKGLEIDNFRFVIETKRQYDIEVQYHANKQKRTKDLVNDDDIY